MNMFKPSEAKNAQEYFDMLPEDRRKDLLYLDKYIKKTAPRLKPVFVSNMPGYGIFSYQNYKKETVNWPIVAVASQKNYISIYVCSLVDGKYVAEQYKDKLGKVSVGKSCIRFKKLEDLNLQGLSEVLRLAQKSPGLAQ